MQVAFIITEQIVVMFFIIAVGVIAYKTNIVTKEGNKYLSNVVLNIVMPAMVFNAYQTAEYSRDLLLGLGYAFILSVICFAIFIPVSMVAFRKDENKDYLIERFSIIYTNCAFMGFPLIDGVFGAEGILYTTSFVTVFNLLVWTHGVMLMKDEINFKSFLIALKSPTVITVVVGVVCYLLRIFIPQTPLRAIEFVASMNTPLAMIIAGVTIAQTNIIKSLKNKRIYFVILMRLLILPIISLLVMKIVPASETVYVSIVIAAACPTAAIGTLFAINYNKNAAYAAEIFAITTLLSAITIPVITIISQTM